MENSNAVTFTERDVDYSSTGSSFGRHEEEMEVLVPFCEAERMHGSEKPWSYAHESNAPSICDSNIDNDDQRQKQVNFEEPKGLMPSGRTFRTNIFVYGRNFSVTITSEAAVAQQWLGSRDSKMYGMDLEWKPNRYVGQENKVALLQICADTECLMLQMLFLDLMPPGLVNFLLDVEQKIAGVGIYDDAKKLLRDYGLHCKGLVDLTVLAGQRLGKAKCRKMGLKSLAKEIIGLVVEKPKRITLSDWAKPVLDRHQIEYACADAWLSYAIYEKLMTSSQWAVPKKRS